MIYEELIAHRVRIAQKGERYFFSIPLPKDTRRIIGIETAVELGTNTGWIAPKNSQLYMESYPNAGLVDTSKIPPMPVSFEYFNTGVIGELQLAVSGNADVFYTERISSSDSFTANFMDPLFNLWMFYPLVNLGKREEDVVDVHPGMGMIEASYRNAESDFLPPYDLKIFIRVDFDHRMEL